MSPGDALRAATAGDEIVGTMAADVTGVRPLATTFGVDEDRWHVVGLSLDLRAGEYSLAAVAVDRRELDALDGGLDELAARSGGALPVYLLRAPHLDLRTLLASGVDLSVVGVYRHVDLPVRVAQELDVGEEPEELPDCS